VRISRLRQIVRFPKRELRDRLIELDFQPGSGGPNSNYERQYSNSPRSPFHDRLSTRMPPRHLIRNVFFEYRHTSIARPMLVQLPFCRAEKGPSMIRFGLLGCGRIAKRHSDLLGGHHVNGASLVAVCDPIQERAEAIASRFSVPAIYHIDEFLARTDMDAVAVLTPSGMHPEHVIACARAGKHVVVEKPMALRLQDADDMIRACDKAGVKLFVVKQNRFNVPVMKAREALEAGRFGRLILGTVRVRWCRDQAYYDQDAWRGTWAYDGGVLTNQASHHVDMLEWFFGDVVTVHARAVTALAKIETEDTAIATLKFRSGALGIIEATTAARPTDLEGSLSILGERGTVEIAGFAVNQIRHWRFVDESPSDKEVVEKFSVNPPNVYGFGHQAYYQHVIDCLINQRAALVDGLEGRKSLELISALYESIETGQEVALRFTPRLSRLGVAS
jgi:UDP-N-acetyl-2-amino-2-deoxyglucuronate dehydrogenase